MRKKTLKFTVEKIFWYLLLLLPIISYLIWLCAMSGAMNLTSLQDMDGIIILQSLKDLSMFSSFCDAQGILFDSSNVIFTTFVSLFGSSGVFPVFDTAGNAVVWYMTYIVHMYIFRIIVEVLSFLPELCHKFKERMLGE